MYVYFLLFNCAARRETAPNHPLTWSFEQQPAQHWGEVRGASLQLVLLWLLLQIHGEGCLPVSLLPVLQLSAPHLCSLIFTPISTLAPVLTREPRGHFCQGSTLGDLTWAVFFLYSL